MFGIGFSELLVIMFVILIVFGPEKLPEAANTFGKLMGSFKRNSDALRREFYNSVYQPAEEIKSRVDLSARELMSFANINPEDLNCEQKALKAELDLKKAQEALLKGPEQDDSAEQNTEPENSDQNPEKNISNLKTEENSNQ